MQTRAQSQAHSVFSTAYAYEPTIAVDPTDPRRLVAAAFTGARRDSTRTNFPFSVTLSLSSDGGTTWTTLQPPGAFAGGDPVAGAAPDGTLYLLALSSPGLLLFRVPPTLTPQQAAQGTSGVTSPVVLRTPNDKPWLTVDPRDGSLYVVTSAPEHPDLASPLTDVLFLTSHDRGDTWSPPVALPRPPLEPNLGGAQVMLGPETTLAVAWIAGQRQESPAWPRPIWITTSTDGGATFSIPQELGTSWGWFTTAFHEQHAHVVFRSGEGPALTLLLAHSQDGGATWRTVSVSGGVPLYYGSDKAPGVGVAPNGRIDVAFYAHGTNAPACVDPAAVDAASALRAPPEYVDPCTYDVYLTSSDDGGETFRPPLRLNQAPIRGADFPRTQGIPRPGEYMGMASTDQYAYPIWIETHADGTPGTQAMVTQVAR